MVSRRRSGGARRAAGAAAAAGSGAGFGGRRLGQGISARARGVRGSVRAGPVPRPARRARGSPARARRPGSAPGDRPARSASRTTGRSAHTRIAWSWRLPPTDHRLWPRGPPGAYGPPVPTAAGGREDVGGQVGQAELRLPGARLVRLAPGLDTGPRSAPAPRPGGRLSRPVNSRLAEASGPRSRRAAAARPRRTPLADEGARRGRSSSLEAGQSSA